MSYMGTAPPDPLPLPERPGIKSRYSQEDTVWYAFMTRPQGEFKAAEALRFIGHTVFVPVEYKVRKVRRPKKNEPKERRIVYPMFRGYIFVESDDPLPWMRMLMLEDPMGRRYLRGVVGIDGRPAPIRDTDMGAIMLMSGEAVPHRKSVSTHKAFRKGDFALITEGPFANLAKKVQLEAIKDGKAEIFVSLFKQSHRVKVPLEHLEAA